MTKQKIDSRTLQAGRLLRNLGVDLTNCSPLSLKMKMWNYAKQQCGIKELADASIDGVDFDLLSEMFHNELSRTTTGTRTDENVS